MAAFQWVNGGKQRCCCVNCPTDCSHCHPASVAIQFDDSPTIPWSNLNGTADWTPATDIRGNPIPCAWDAFYQWTDGIQSGSWNVRLFCEAVAGKQQWVVASIGYPGTIYYTGVTYVHGGISAITHRIGPCPPTGGPFDGWNNITDGTREAVAITLT